MILNDQNTAFLEHHGVLGMKWGHRTKATGADIRTARRAISTKQNAISDAHDKAKATTKRGTPERKAAIAKVDAMVAKGNKELLPQRVLASRMTRGEKAVAVILAGPFAAIPIGITSANSRRLENQLDKTKKK